MRSPDAPARQPVFNRTRIALGLCLVVAVALYTQRKAIHELHDHFFGEHSGTSFELAELSGDWTEQTVQTRLAGHPIWCGRYEGNLAADRACGVKVNAYNGLPALHIGFFFNASHLRQVAISLPSWAHADAHAQLLADFGAPYASQFWAFPGPRLNGWRRPDGAGLFINRDRPLNPLQTNAIYWRSATECELLGCFVERLRPAASTERSN